MDIIQCNYYYHYHSIYPLIAVCSVLQTLSVIYIDVHCIDGNHEWAVRLAQRETDEAMI